jgi:hypothetical protein
VLEQGQFRGSAFVITDTTQALNDIVVVAFLVDLNNNSQSSFLAQLDLVKPRPRR